MVDAILTDDEEDETTVDAFTTEVDEDGTVFDSTSYVEEGLNAADGDGSTFT